MKVNLAGFIGDGGGRSVVDAFVEHVEQAREEGFTRVWTGQMPWEPDLLTLLAAAFSQVPDIELGTAVLPIQVAHPMLTAQRALTLSVLAEGRFTSDLE